MDEADWGECDDEQRAELVSGLGKFASELNEAIKSMTGGVKLRTPSIEFDIGNIKEAADNERVVQHFE